MEPTIWTITLQESLTEGLEMLIVYLPKAIGALIILVIGLIVGRLIAAAATRVLGLMGTDLVSTGFGISALLQQMGIKKPPSQVLGSVTFWVIFLLFLIAAMHTLGLATLSEALKALASYLPSLALAILIAVAGLIVANLIRDLITSAARSANIPQAQILAQVAYVVILFLAIVMGITELGVNTALLNGVILLVMAGIVGAAALSFGLGGRQAMANFISAYTLRPYLQVGRRVQVGSLAGTVVALTPMAVILETQEGRVRVPASQFADTTTVLQPHET